MLLFFALLAVVIPHEMYSSYCSKEVVDSVYNDYITTYDLSAEFSNSQDIIYECYGDAAMAQLVEHMLGKHEVISSTLISSSRAQPLNFGSRAS